MPLPILIVFLFSCTNGDSSVPPDHVLHKSLQHFDTMHKDDVSHEMLYQSTHTGYHLRMVKFYTLGRNFHLHLTPQQRLFSDDFVAYHVDRHGNMTLYEVNKNHFYSGHVLGETRSSVAVHISDSGVFTGTVAMDTEVYHFEPSKRFINTPHDYHMITYRRSDVKFEFSDRSLDYQYAPVVNDEDNHDYQQPIGKFIQDSTTGRHGNSRLRRAPTGNRTSCQMYLVADTYFFNSIGNNDVADSIIYMVTIMADLNQQTYRIANFTLSNGLHVTDLGIQVAAIMVHKEFNDDLDRFPYNRNDGADIDEVLNRFSTLPSTNAPINEPQQDRYCLAHLFTFRSFSQNRLGLANIASSALGTTGGICSTVVRVSGSRRVYNTGVSSFIIGERLLFRVESQLVVAHEIGHNWGSVHDTDAPCNNNFLMNAYSQAGDNRNNYLLSSCSRAMIGNVLSSKGDCFVDTQQSLCGNFVVDEEEQCDAGLNLDDPCCDSQCHFKPGAVCSDMNEDCCTNCTVSSQDKVCHIVVGDISTDCTNTTYCNGENSMCPELESLAEGTRCIFGQCTADNSGTTSCTSLCVARSLTSCSCREDDACRVCCLQNNSCTPLVGVTESLEDGVPCIGDEGRNGTCIDGMCMVEEQDEGNIRRFLRFIENLTGDAVIRAIEENVVGFILICTLLVWVPVSLLIHFLVDEKLYKRALKHLQQEKEKVQEMISLKEKPPEHSQNPPLELTSDFYNK